MTQGHTLQDTRHHKPVSTSLNLRDGVRGTSGRPPAEPPSASPKLDEESARLLEVAAAGNLHVLKFAEVMVTSPSRAGVQALAYLAFSAREAARKKYPAPADDDIARAVALEKAAKRCAAALAEKGASDGLRDALTKTLANVYVAGVRAGQANATKAHEAERAKLPAVLRETTFVTDSKDRVIGKTEREYRSGGIT